MTTTPIDPVMLENKHVATTRAAGAWECIGHVVAIKTQQILGAHHERFVPVLCYFGPVSLMAKVTAVTTVFPHTSLWSQA